MIGLQIYSASFLLEAPFTIFFSLKGQEQQNTNEDNEQKPGLSTDLQ